MAQVITQEDMWKYSGMSKATFRSGTILTPLAKDFAFSNKIEIVFNDSHEEPLRGDGTETCEADRVKLLRDIIKAVIANIEKVGKDVSKAEIEMLVKACLKKLGCSIN